MKLIEKKILIISNEHWGEVWYSKQHYAHELSKNNCVYFIDPCAKWRPMNLFHNKPTIKKVQDNIFVIKYVNFLPALNMLLFRINNFLVSKSLKGLFIKNQFENFVYWSFDPCRLYNPSMMGSQLSIFHAVDPYRLTFFGEKFIYKNVDVIVFKGWNLFNAHFIFLLV